MLRVRTETMLADQLERVSQEVPQYSLRAENDTTEIEGITFSALCCFLNLNLPTWKIVSASGSLHLLCL